MENYFTFKEQFEPNNKKDFILLNPRTYSNLYAKDFYKSNENCDNSYTSTDPRLISIFHNGQQLELDRPPMDGSMKMKDIYNPELNNYGKPVYKNYKDINAGQIMYYIDRSIEDTLHKPLFNNPALIDGELYTDPMSSTYPEYRRIPVSNENVLNTKNRLYSDGLSSLSDTNEFREDIINLQMRPQNRVNYAYRNTGNILV